MIHSCIRLSIADSATAKRTRDLYSFIPAVSNSSSNKSSDMRQSSASKSLEQRREFFGSKQ